MSTATRPPQLNLDELRRLKWLLGGTLALVSLWTVFFLDVEALALVGIAGGAIAAAMLWPQLPSRVPPIIWRLAVPGIIVATITDWFFSKETLPVLIRLAVLLVLYRGASYRRKREDLQLIVLGLFLIVVAGVLTVSLGFAFLLLLFTACALGFLFVITLIDMTERTAVALTYEEMSQCPPWARGGWRRLLGRLRQVADWRLIGFASVLFAGVVAMSAVLFMIIPRFELATGFFLDKYITRKSRTGFTETVRFGDVGELVRDESIAMRVDLSDAASLKEPPYWRLVVLDEYTPQGFKLSQRLKNELLASQTVRQSLNGRVGGAFFVRGEGGVWTFYIEPGVSRFLPLPGAFGTLRLRDPVPVQSSYPARANEPPVDGAGLVALRTEPMAMTAFQLDGVEMNVPMRDRRFERLLKGNGRLPVSSDPDNRAYDPRITLEPPAGDANRAALAGMIQEITGGAKLSATDFANKATEWIRSRHAYALSARIPKGDKDDIVKWLESREPGFCEYFAAGLAVLSRAAGHPSRVIAGFHGGSLNAFENYYMVKNADAHAWVEIFDRTSGLWRRIDPTPGAVNAGPEAQAAATAAAQQQDSSWSARFDSLRVIWYRRIVNFDSRQQVQMIESVKTFTNDSSTALRTRLEGMAKKLKAWLAGPWDLKRLGRTLTGASLALLLVALGARSLRWLSRSWRRWRQPGKFDPVRQEAGRWLGKIAAESTPLAEAPELTRVREDLLRLRYGRRETWPEPRTVFRQAKRARRAARNR